MHRNQTARTELGFTLVELAIVMVVIGILIGGIIKGQELMRNARLLSTIAQIKSYQSSIIQFRDVYDSLPGDLPSAVSRLAGCTAGNFCSGGNGDGIVGAFAPSWNELLVSQAGVSTVPQVETTLFWKHLSLAGFISGIGPAGNPSEPGWGVTHPITASGGGLHAAHGNYTALGRQFTGLVLQMRLPMFGLFDLVDGANVGPLLPKEAAYIDKKLDDGSPNSGDILSPDTGSLCDGANGSGDYNYSSSNKNCNLTFRVF